MLSKLAWRNMKRSLKDYIVYALTMTVITAFMYAFNSLIFQNELSQYFDIEGLMGVMIGLATVFIVLIVAWLINYMVKFMLEKRSSEFGIYLLLGMKRKKISRLYILENVLLGLISFALGIIAGIFLFQVLFAILCAMVQMEYHLHISFHWATILMTVLCYAGCYLLALFRCKRKFRKMNINDLMNAKRQNEEIKEKHENIKRILLPLSVLFLIAFWVLFKQISNAVQLIGFLVGLVLTIYLFYMGLSAWIICYLRKKKNGIYRGQNLFLLRQFSSKVRTMQFTMGTLSGLFTIALMGACVALMFSEYENTVLQTKFPFDVQVYSPKADEDFTDAKKILEEDTQPADIYIYRIYTDRGNQANSWMLSHLRTFGNEFRKKDGTIDQKKIDRHLASDDRWSYCTCDTYMGISDYNHLRKMLGYDRVSLREEEYIIQMKPRLKEETTEMGRDLQIQDPSGRPLSYAGMYTEEFSQDGHNGGDYLIVVPDRVLTGMEPYYSVLAADITGEAPTDLFRKLNNESAETDFGGQNITMQTVENGCAGSDNILVFAQDIIVRDNLIPEAKFLLGAIIIPLLYIGLVFLCVAMTVLSVQQLSDSAKYKFRYDVLGKLGLKRAETHRLILKQLAAYYLCPALLAIIISGRFILYISGIFVQETAVPFPAWAFFLESVLTFFGIYLIYFAVTYICFIRNIEE